MADLVERDRRFATEVHRRIGHTRKYTRQPYDAHLAAVAQLVEEVTDDPEMIAAAWLHDTVEDTPATIEDIEAQFGGGVARMVSELTDVSRPGDGNRAARKELDRRHLSLASARSRRVGSRKRSPCSRNVGVAIDPVSCSIACSSPTRPRS